MTSYPYHRAKQPSSLDGDECRGLVLCAQCGRQAQIRRQNDPSLCYLCDTEKRIETNGGAKFLADVDERRTRHQLYPTKFHP